MIDVIDAFLHMDRLVGSLAADYGLWIYFILFLIVFCETGLVFLPFLPGDSLLFLAGALVASGAFDMSALLTVFILSAILGDTVNYWIGNKIGRKLLEGKKFIDKGYLDATKHFYEKHGGKTIVISRFIPFIRTFAPFVAGIGKMEYGRFLTYNVLGGIVWVVTFLAAGYYFGNIPIVSENFGLVVLGIIVVTVLSALVGVLRHRMKSAGKK